MEKAQKQDKHQVRASSQKMKQQSEIRRLLMVSDDTLHIFLLGIC